MASQASTCGVRLVREARAASSASVRASDSAERSTPEPADITCWISARTGGSSRTCSTASSPAGSTGTGTSVHGRLLARSAPIRSAKTRPSSSELEASRFAPWTPVQATSPQAYRRGTLVRPHVSVRTPPEA